MENRNNKDNNNKSPNRKLLLIFLASAVLLFCFYSYLSSLVQKNTNKEITYTQFNEMVADGQVKKVTISGDRIIIETEEVANAPFQIKYYTGYI